MRMVDAHSHVHPFYLDVNVQMADKYDEKLNFGA